MGGIDESVQSNDSTKKSSAADSHSQCWKVFKTGFALVGVYICLGLSGEITGPTLLDLKLKTDSNYESVSTGVSGRSAGAFAGAALGGVLVDKLGLYCDVMLAIALDTQAVATVALPWMPSTGLIFAMTFVQGMMEEMINICGQKMILTMWREKAAGPIHLLHGGFGIGSFIIPLIANPFLAVTKMSSVNSSTDNVTSVAVTEISTTVANTEKEIIVRESRIEYAYLIAALISVCVSLMFYGYHFLGGKDRQMEKERSREQNFELRSLSVREMFNPATCAGGRFFYGVQILFLVFVYFILAVGGERVAGKFIRTYAIKYVDFSDDDGSYINTVFWVAFTVGRVLGLLTARLIPIRTLILLETGGCLVTSVLLLIFGDDSAMALWILIAFMGFFIGPLFPSGVGWTNYHIEMTGMSITFFSLGSAVGGLIFMKLTGYLFDNYGYKTFLYLLVSFGAAAFTLAPVMNIVGAQHGNRFKQSQPEIEQTEGPTKTEGKEITFDNFAYKSATE